MGGNTSLSGSTVTASGATGIRVGGEAFTAEGSTITASGATAILVSEGSLSVSNSNVDAKSNATSSDPVSDFPSSAIYVQNAFTSRNSSLVVDSTFVQESSRHLPIFLTTSNSSGIMVGGDATFEGGNTSITSTNGPAIVTQGKLNAVDGKLNAVAENASAVCALGTASIDGDVVATFASTGDLSKFGFLAAGNLTVNGGLLKATGSEAALVMVKKGKYVGEEAPIRYGENVEDLADKMLAAILAHLSPASDTAGASARAAATPYTFWSFSETGTIGWDDATSSITGASKQAVIGTPPTYFLKVDGQVMVAANDKADIVDASIPNADLTANKATFTAADRTLTLTGIPMNEDNAAHPERVPTFNGIETWGLAAESPTGAFTLNCTDGALISSPQTVVAEDGTATTPDEPLLKVAGPLRLTGEGLGALAVLGKVATEADSFGHPGSIVQDGGQFAVIGLTGDGVNVAMKGNQDKHDASFTLSGGSCSIIAMDKMSALSVDGDVDVRTSAEGTTHSLMSLNKQGVEVAGTFSLEGGTLAIMGNGGTGLHVQNLNGMANVITLVGGSSTVQGMLYDGSNTPCFGIVSEQGDVVLSGGSHQVTNVGMNTGDAGLRVKQGNLIGTGGTMFVALALGADGTVLDETCQLQMQGANMETMGMTGARVGSAQIDSGSFTTLSQPWLSLNLGNIDGSILAALGVDTSKLDEILKRLQDEGVTDSIDAVAGGEVLSSASAEEVSAANMAAVQANEAATRAGTATQEYFGLYAANSVQVTGGVVNAYAFQAGPLGNVGKAGDHAYGIHAGNVVEVLGGTVTALADVSSSDNTATAGIHAGDLQAPFMGGRIAITGGTTTAYGFSTADTCASIVTEFDGVQMVGDAMKVAAGAQAPGDQVSAQTKLADYPYAYVTAGDLYLADEYVKWDDVDKTLMFAAAAFDPANGHHKMTKEMMAALVGLNHLTMITSDNVDFRQGSLLQSYLEAAVRAKLSNPDDDNLTASYSAAFSGQGAVFMFQSSTLMGTSTLHNVDGVEVYDFGSRYDTNPELAGMRPLVPGGQALIHSVHFNYEGELPANTSVLLTVGEVYKDKPVTWAYSDAAFTGLTIIAQQTVDSFGWITVDGQTVLNHETVLYGDPQGSSPASDSGKRTLVPTGDEQGGIAGALLISALVAAAMVGVAQRRKSSKNR